MMKTSLLILTCLSFSISLHSQNLKIKEKVNFLALGDSYTIGQSVPVNGRWPVQLIDALRKKGFQCNDAKIIATTGWRTDDLDNAIDNANLSNNYNLVSLLIGVNNFYQGKSVESYAPEFEALLVKSIQLAGGDVSSVFVVSIPDYGYTPFGKSNQASISKGIDDFNAVNKSIADKLKVTYFNITDISRRGLKEPDLVAGDGLHPSAKMYSEWVQLIMNSVDSKDEPVDEPVDEPADEPHDSIITGTIDGTQEIKIFPNPFNQELLLENLPVYEKIKIQLSDSLGKVIYDEESFGNRNFILNTATLPSGIYYYEILTAVGVLISGKLIKY